MISTLSISITKITGKNYILEEAWSLIKKRRKTVGKEPVIEDQNELPPSVKILNREALKAFQLVENVVFPEFLNLLGGKQNIKRMLEKRKIGSFLLLLILLNH